MKEDNQVKNNSLIFEYLGVISFIATTFICAWSYPIFKLLFTEQYLSGYIVAPYLFLAPLLQMLFQVAGNQFLVIKKTWPNMIILSSGAVVNVVINFSLIPILGIEGASLATLLGYVVSDIVCVVVLYKMKLIVLEKRFILAVLGMAGYYIVWRLFITSNWLVGTLFALVAAVYFIYLYKKELISIARKLRKR
jgi:O-antigen/teichoic acid export membrane protein